MQFIYPAVFSRTPKGYLGRFPDLDGCIVEAQTLEEAVEEAHYACETWLMVELDEDAPFLPPVSDLSDLTLGEGETARNICVTLRLTDGWDE